MAGADAILIIVAALTPAELRALHRTADACQLDVLVEVHTREEMDRAIDLGATLIGINNRNLHTFDVTLATTENLAPRIPADRIIVAESGMFAPTDLARLEKVRAQTYLIGESLMRQADVASATKLILTRP